MPSHLSSIGFQIETKEDFVELARRVSLSAESIPVPRGKYLHWAGTSGEELWLQLDYRGNLVGMNPHFRGRSTIRVGLQARVTRNDDTELDGAFQAWASPDAGSSNTGAYPFVFDLPDAATYSDIDLPGMADATIIAFAHEVTIYDSLDAYDSSQDGDSVKFASQSFIPSGMFNPNGGSTNPPTARAIFTGHVVDGGVRKNSLTHLPYYWALVDTLGGRYDVVIDRMLLQEPPTPGGVLSGSFWLSGRLTSYPRIKRSWFGKLLGGTG